MSTFQFVVALVTALPGLLTALGALFHSRSVSARVAKIEGHPPNPRGSLYQRYE